MAHTGLFTFLAFIGVLVAIVALALLGEGTDIAILTGLVGVLGSFKPWTPQAAAPVEPLRGRSPPHVLPRPPVITSYSLARGGIPRML